MLYQPDKLSSDIQVILSDLSNTLYLSSISYYEICYKYAIGKLDDFDDLARNIECYASQLDLTTLPVEARHAATAGRLAWSNRDPFDRILAGQALSDSLLFVTSDEAFKSLDKLRSLW
jgi:PIN domain nuclease of toxin-antitoxin system